MKFVTLADLAKTIRDNIRKVPHDIDFVIGIPRSGVMAGSMIAEFLNVPLIDVDSFIFGAMPTGGCRLRFHKKSGREIQKVLVVDDTIWTGGQLKKAKEKLAPFTGNYEFIYCVVFREGPADGADIWLEDVREYTDGFSTFVLYEWNIFHHGNRIMSSSMYDIDGVFCVDPPDERDEKAYMEYIANATPLFLPSNKIGGIVSYRLAKNETITRKWLEDHNISYGQLTLFPSQTYSERAASGIRPSVFKADIYMSAPWAKLFVESSDGQAKEIFRMTGKPVYCVETNRMYA